MVQLFKSYLYKMPGPNIYDLQRVFFDEHYCVSWLASCLVFYPSIPCEGCGGEVQMKLERQKFRCGKHTCRKECSIRKFTFFYGSALPCSKILFLGFLWVCGTSWTAAQRITGHSPNTITSFYSHFRRLVSSDLEDDDQIIGGDGIEVEIDETKLGKRKYHRGHRVDGVWVLAGVERTAERKAFLVAVPDRSSETLLPIIHNHVRPGSIVLTDMWRGYSGITTNLGLEHHQVNHSVEFVNSVDGTTTNTIEGTNNAIKFLIKPRNRTEENIEGFLHEFIWRRKHENNTWDGFVNALREIHYSF